MRYRINVTKFTTPEKNVFIEKGRKNSFLSYYKYFFWSNIMIFEKTQCRKFTLYATKNFIGEKPPKSIYDKIFGNFSVR